MKKCSKCGREYQDTHSLCTSDGTVLQKAGDALLGQILADKYRIEERISEGGMGAVYRATHVLMDKTVAIKVLHPSLAADEKIVQRFSREARAASRISHPHALNVTDFGESGNGIVFLVMEFLRGCTLKEAVQKDGPMPLPRVVEIMRQVTGALAAAHAEGVIHRDLKSDNIMLVDADKGQDWAKVLDFGIAKIQEPIEQDPALTAPNLIIGTPQYMSPEQCSQVSELDARTDIYSLGIILYEMLAGHVPFTGDSPTTIMLKQLQESPPPLLEERADLPPDVSGVVMRALAKRPEERYQTVSELTEALTLAAQSEDQAGAGNLAARDAQSRSTARIVVPTKTNEAPRATAQTEHNEATIVASPHIASAVTNAATINQSPASAPPESFNPWRILIPATVGLLVVFAVVYAITSRNSHQPTATNQNASQLTSDPNSQPVKPAQAPTGQSEKGIAASVPAPSPNSNTNLNANASAAEKLNGEGSETLPAIVNTNTNAARRNTGSEDQASPANENAAGVNDIESNSNKANKNAARVQLPQPQTSPSVSIDSDTAEPTPAQKKKQTPLPKPTSPPATAVPPAPVSAPENSPFR
jgi:serine/threonine-protein kinase